jgi:flavin-dependent dehydrogenase
MIVRKKLIGGLLRSRAVRDIFREHIKPSRMYKEVLEDFKTGAATKADKIRTAITGLRAYANAYYKQSLKAQKADKNPKTKKVRRKLMRELAFGINQLKKSANKAKASEVSKMMTARGIKKNFKGGLIVKPKLAKRGF